MGAFSEIAWTDHTFNPWIGCQKVSPGCQFCYAERETFVRRERSHGRELWGPTGSRYHTSANYWYQPIKWNASMFWECEACHWRGFLPKLAACPACGAAIKSTRQRVFCMSLGDVLEDRPELVPWRGQLYDLIDATPNLDWLLLTKRIEKSDLLPYVWLHEHWPDNVWMGTSIENQKVADERIPLLNKLPANQRFLSIEPMLEAVDIDGSEASWVIVGGESGPRCRPFNWDWARSIKADCQEIAASFFMKQGGGHPNKRDNLDDIPEDLRIREWPK